MSLTPSMRTARGALLALALTPCAAFAAPPTPTPQPSPTPPSEIGRVSTSDRHDEPLAKTTRSTYVVDRAQIDARGARSIADALEDVPGVELYRYGAFGAEANVAIRGASATSVLVLLDGVPVTPGSNEQLDLGTLSTTGVRRIEIVEGSGATLYGSNAVGGVINIITDVPRTTDLDVSDGTLQDRDLRVAAGDGKLGISFERHIASNDFSYPPVPIPGATAAPAGSRSNADAEQTAARIAYDLDLGSSFTARLRFGADQLDLGVPGAVTYPTDLVARQNLSRDEGHVEVTHAGPHSATTVTLDGFHQTLDYVDPSTATENPTIDGRTQVSLRDVVDGGASTTTFGLDLARESAVLGNLAQYNAAGAVAGYATIGQTQAESAFYVQEQLTLGGGVQLNGGLRGENDAPLGSAATPSLGVGIPLGNGVRLTANAGTAFRVPTIIDRYYPGYANPDLRPERSKDADVTVQSSAFMGGASLGYFLRDSTDLIELNSAYVPENVARSSIRGLIGTLRTRPFHGFVSTLSVTDTYRAQDTSPGAPASRLYFTPVVVTKFGLERDLGPSGLRYGAQANVYGPHAESVGFNPDGQTTIDVFARARVSRGVMLSLRANNIGNERYEPIVGYPAPGRTVEFELSTR